MNVYAIRPLVTDMFHHNYKYQPHGGPEATGRGPPSLGFILSGP